MGRYIRHIRLDRGQSQRGLAREAGIANTTLCDIELGRMQPSLRTLGLIAAAFDLTRADLLSAADRFWADGGGEPGA